MIGVTINFVYDIFTCIDRRKNCVKYKLDFELYNILKTKIFETEDEAVKWIINVIPVSTAIPNELLDKNKKISLKQCIDTLHNFWNEETNRDLYHYHNSRIIRFGDGIIDTDDEHDYNEEDDEEV